MLKRSVFGVLIVLLLLVLIAATAIFFVQRDRALLTAVIEDVASRFLDRQLQIGELLEADVGRDTYLVASNVRLGNPDWAHGEDFFTAERLLIHINLPSIWRDGPVVIKKIELDGVRLNLLAPENQAPNWDFWPDATLGDIDAAPDDLMEDISGLVFPVLIASARVRKSELVYKDPNQNLVTFIESLDIIEPSDGGLIDIDLLGSINDLPLKVDGQVGPTTALLTRENLNWNLSILLGKIEIESRGRLDNLVELKGVDIHLSLSALNARPLLALMGITGVRDGPLNVQVHLLEADTAVGVSVVGAMDDFTMRIDGALRDLKELDGVDINFQLDGPSLAEAGAAFDVLDLPDLAYHVSGSVKRSGKLFSLDNGLIEAGSGYLRLAGSLPGFPEIDDWNFSLSGARFRLGVIGAFFGVKGLPDSVFDLKGQLRSTDEGVELLDLNLVSVDSSLNVSGSIGESPGYFDSKLGFSLRGKSLRHVGGWLGVSDFPELAFHASGQVGLKASGWQLRDGALKAGDVELSIAGELDKLPAPTQLSSQVEVTASNIAAALSDFGYGSDGLPAVPLMLTAQLSGSLQKLVLDQAIVKSGESLLTANGLLGDPVTLKELDMQFEMLTPDLLAFMPSVESTKGALLPLQIRGQLKNSEQGIAANNVSGQMGGAALTLNGVYNREVPHESSRVSFNTSGSDLGRLLSPFLRYEVASVPFQLSLDASIQSSGIKIDAINTSVGDTRLTATGYIASLDELAIGKGHIELSGPSSANLAAMLGAEVPVPDSDFTLMIGVDRSNEWLRLDPVALRWGESDYDGTIAIRPGEIPTVNVDLHSDYVSLPFLLPNLQALEKEALTASPDDEADTALLYQDLTSKEQQEKFFSDQPLNLQWMNSVQATFKYRLDEMGFGNNTSTSATLDLSIADGVLSSRQMSWNGTFASGEAQLSAGTVKAGSAVALYFDVERIPLLWLLGGEPDADPLAYYRGDFTSSGQSVRELAKNLNGALVFKAGGGLMNNKGADLILGDAFEEIFSRLNPYRKTDTHTRIDCHAGALTIVNGRVAAVPGLVVRADKMDVISSGEINLRNEKLNLAFNTRSRKGLGFSASKAVTPYFKIGGTLAHPRLALDVKGAAVSGGAAVATAGVSILAEGLWDRWVATSKNPCDRLIQQVTQGGNNVFTPLLQARPL
jgi:hypothetical protein